MTLTNLIDCILWNQEIEIYISDPESGYLSERKYIGTKSGIFKVNKGILSLEVDSLEICRHTAFDTTLKIICLSNQW